MLRVEQFPCRSSNSSKPRCVHRTRPLRSSRFRSRAAARRCLRGRDAASPESPWRRPPRRAESWSDPQTAGSGHRPPLRLPRREVPRPTSSALGPTEAWDTSARDAVARRGRARRSATNVGPLFVTRDVGNPEIRPRVSDARDCTHLENPTTCVLLDASLARRVTLADATRAPSKSRPSFTSPQRVVRASRRSPCLRVRVTELRRSSTPSCRAACTTSGTPRWPRRCPTRAGLVRSRLGPSAPELLRAEIRKCVSVSRKPSR